MSDYIDRKRAANFLCKIICGSDRGLCVSTPENCQQKRMMAFFELPAADVVPVVRCGECRHSTLPSATTQAYTNPEKLTCHYGPCNRRNVNKNDFCSYGERKNNGI